MKVTVIDIAGVAPERVFNQPETYESADSAWMLTTSGCREPGMAQPVQCDASIVNAANGHNWSLNRITRAATYQPWIGRQTRAAWSRKGRIFIGDPTSESIMRVDALKRVGPRVILGHGHLDRLLVAGPRIVALLDHNGQLQSTHHFDRHHPPLIGGFSTDGTLYVQLTQAGPHQPAALEGYDTNNGDHVASIDAASVNELIDRAIRTPFPAKSYTDSARKSLWGGWWIGRISVTAHPEDRAMTLGMSIPTGETCELFGKTAALVNQHWIRLTVEA